LTVRPPEHPEKWAG